MMQTEASRLTREDKRYLEVEIKELEKYINNVQEMRKEATSDIGRNMLDNEISLKTKELQRLRRLRI